MTNMRFSRAGVVALIMGGVFILLTFRLQAAGGDTVLYAPLVMTKPLQDIVFVSNRGEGFGTIFRMKEDGSEVTRLFDSYGSDPDYSPDGTKIAFVSQDCNGCADDIFVMNEDGTGVTQLTHTELIDEGFPDWSPDGTQIVFTRAEFDLGIPDLYIMNHDGTNVRRLTDLAYFPQWLPDGARIGFLSAEAGPRGISTINTDGTGETLLPYPDNLEGFQPVWSPDGAKIAFDGYSTCPPCLRDIYVMNADGSDITQLTNTPDDEQRAAWSPDGARIAFDITFYGTEYYAPEIYVMDVDGSNITPLTDSGPLVANWAASWRPK